MRYEIKSRRENLQVTKQDPQLTTEATQHFGLHDLHTNGYLTQPVGHLRRHWTPEDSDQIRTAHLIQAQYPDEMPDENGTLLISKNPAITLYGNSKEATRRMFRAKEVLALTISVNGVSDDLYFLASMVRHIKGECDWPELEPLDGEPGVFSPFWVSVREAGYIARGMKLVDRE